MPETLIPAPGFPLCMNSFGWLDARVPDIYLKNVVRGACGGHLMVVLFKQATGDLFTAAGRSSRMSTVRRGRLRMGCSVSMAEVACAVMAAPGVSMTSA